MPVAKVATAREHKIESALEAITNPASRGSVKPAAFEVPAQDASQPHPQAAPPPASPASGTTIPTTERPASPTARVSRGRTARAAGAGARRSLQTRELVIRLPESLEDVLTQLTGPELREAHPVHRSFYLTPEHLEMLEDLHSRFGRDRSAIARVAIALLHLVVTHPPHKNPELFPIQPPT